MNFIEYEGVSAQDRQRRTGWRSAAKEEGDKLVRRHQDVVSRHGGSQRFVRRSADYLGKVILRQPEWLAVSNKLVRLIEDERSERIDKDSLALGFEERCGNSERLTGRSGGDQRQTSPRANPIESLRLQWSKQSGVSSAEGCTS